MKIQEIIQQAIDIHVHIGPEIIPRKYTVDTFIKAQESKLGGAVFKNHFYPTAPFIANARKTTMQLFGGIVLNNAVGGLNPEGIYASKLLSDKPVMVWLPTINAEQFLKESMYEIAPEWVQQKNFSSRKASLIKPIVVTENGKITKQMKKVLKTIKQYDCALATGHIAWNETVTIVDEALKLGLERIVISHPIYQRINMPVNIQKKLAKKGCFIEQCYSMYAIDKISIAEIAKQIKSVGPASVILSSDTGQLYSPPPNEALFTFATLLQKEGITEEALSTMLVKNPRQLLGLIK